MVQNPYLGWHVKICLDMLSAFVGICPTKSNDKFLSATCPRQAKVNITQDFVQNTENVNIIWGINHAVSLGWFSVLQGLLYTLKNKLILIIWKEIENEYGKDWLCSHVEVVTEWATSLLKITKDTGKSIFLSVWMDWVSEYVCRKPTHHITPCSSEEHASHDHPPEMKF